MAEADDLVALILSALGAASASDLCILSELLASDSSLQLQRLWLLVGSPSRCLSIISFLDSLSQQHRRLLLARVTLRLVCRITDFLEDPASSDPLHRSSMANSAYADMAHPLSRAESLRLSESSNSHLNEEDVPADVENATATPADGGTHRQKEKDSTDSEHVNIIDRGPLYSSASSLPAENSTSMHLADAESLEKPGVKAVNVENVELEGRCIEYCSSSNPTLASLNPVNGNGACSNAASQDRRHAFKQSSNTMMASLESVNPVVAHMHSWTSSPNAICSSLDLSFHMDSTCCEEEMDNLSLPWGEIDAAFLFLFLWETHEQDCQEAMETWCIDPFIYHLLSVQDMAFSVDDKKAGCIRAPRWRERLQQYLRQNVLQVGYGLPGIMASPNLPPSLSAYIDTIGKFQRILETLEVEEGSEQKLPAASAVALHSLPTTVIGLSSEDKGKVCIICKEDLEPSSIASQLPCMHVYHWDCILSWLKQRNNCPVCRHELPSDDYDHELQRKIQILKARAV